MVSKMRSNEPSARKIPPTKTEPVLPVNTSTEWPIPEGDTLIYSGKDVQIWDVANGEAPVSVDSQEREEIGFSYNDVIESEKPSSGNPEDVVDEGRANPQSVAAEAKIQKEKDARVKELKAFDDLVGVLKKKTQVPVAVELANALEQLSTDYKDCKLDNRSQFIEQVGARIASSIDELAKHRQQIPIIGPIIRLILNALQSLGTLFGNNSFFKTDSIKKVDSLLGLVNDMQKQAGVEETVNPDPLLSLKNAADDVDEDLGLSSKL